LKTISEGIFLFSYRLHGVRWFLTFDVMISASQASLSQIGPDLDVTLLRWSSSYIVSCDLSHNHNCCQSFWLVENWKLV